jgi:hypothetical protein
MDAEAWEAWNEAVSLWEGGWLRIVHCVTRLTSWHVGYDWTAPARGEPPTPSYDRWVPVAYLVALAAWRAAIEARLLADDVPLVGVARWLSEDRRAELFAGPRPPDIGLEIDWFERVEERAGGLLPEAREVLERHLLAAGRDDAALHGASPGPPVLLGGRFRAVEAAGPPGRMPQWREDAGRAVEEIDEALRGVRGGRWRPTLAEQRAAARLLPTLGTSPSTLPERSGVSAWLARANRLGDFGAALAERPRLRLDRGRPLPEVLTWVGLATASMRGLAEDLTRLWNRHLADQQPDAWDRQHVPTAVREQIRHLERMVEQLSALLRETAVAPTGDGPATASTLQELGPVEVEVAVSGHIRIVSRCQHASSSSPVECDACGARSGVTLRVHTAGAVTYACPAGHVGDDERLTAKRVRHAITRQANGQHRIARLWIAAANLPADTDVTELGFA